MGQDMLPAHYVVVIEIMGVKDIDENVHLLDHVSKRQLSSPWEQVHGGGDGRASQIGRAHV